MTIDRNRQLQPATKIEANNRGPSRSSSNEDSLITTQEILTEPKHQSDSESSTSSAFQTRPLELLNFPKTRPHQTTTCPLNRTAHIQVEGFKNKHILLFFYLLELLLVPLAVDATIPGCPDLRAIAKADSYNGSFCFCSTQDDDSTNISCLYGSTLKHFKQALLAASAAKKTINQVTFSRVEFDAATLPRKLFDDSYTTIRVISIEKCAQTAPLHIEDNAFQGLAQHLEELYIIDCNLEQFPRRALQNLTKLKSLSLAHNRLTNIEKEDLQPLKQLETLNLEGNFISSLENGTLSVVRDTLKTLSFGSHNFVNSSIFNEISMLTELQVLDMEQADGINAIPQGAFRGLKKLEKLLLPGCSITAIQKDTFQGLVKLRELDLRINLLNKLECGSFAWTPNLRRLSLAGNYLNESMACWWDGVVHLKELDLGWNEFTTLENNAFAKLGPTLSTLNLRHNLRLNQIDEGAFDGLSNLRRLNLSEISITELNNTLRHLSSLKELDLSYGKLRQIDENDLIAQAEKLERLLLRGNQLTTISRSVLENLKNLQELDLSNNSWLCDENMENVVEEIELRYKEAPLMDREFIFLHANETTCDRPYSMRGQIIINVVRDAFKKYNSTEDVIYSSTPAISMTDNGINFDSINASAITELLAKGGLIGEENAKAEHHQDSAIFVRPQYDISMKTEIVNERNQTTSKPTIVAIIMLLLVSIAVTCAVVRHVGKQKKRRVENRPNLEMCGKRTTSGVKQQRHSNIARTDHR